MTAIWPIGSISPELRRGIVRAANDAGLTVEAWLERTISGALVSRPAPKWVSGQTWPQAICPDDLPSLLTAIDRCLAEIHARDLSEDETGKRGTEIAAGAIECTRTGADVLPFKGCEAAPGTPGNAVSGVSFDA